MPSITTRNNYICVLPGGFCFICDREYEGESHRHIDIPRDYKPNLESENYKSWESKKKKLDVPMGISAWKEHGKKYGYWEFFKEQANWELRESLIAFIKVKRTFYKDNPSVVLILDELLIEMPKERLILLV
jgi:hypothetical protein